MKKLVAISGVIAVLCYILLYNLTYSGYICVNHIYKDFMYTCIYTSVATSFFLLTVREKPSTLYWYIYSAIAEFWAFLGLNMLLSIWIYYPSMYHIVIISLGAILLLNIAIAIKPVRNTINNYITQLLNAFKRWFC